MENNLENFIALSQKIGQNISWIQGGGGNTSIKLSSELMAVKSSGTLLKDMKEKSGYTFINTKDLNHQLLTTSTEKDYFSSLLNSVKSDSETCLTRPSMETGFHAFLDTWVIHTHSVYVNVLACVKNYNLLLSKGNTDIIYIDYKTPGYELTNAIKISYNNTPSSIFILQNHGIIVSSPTEYDAYNLHDDINKKIISSLNLDLFEQKFNLRSQSKEYHVMNYNGAYTINQLTHHILFPDQCIYISNNLVKESKGIGIKGTLRQAQAVYEIICAYDYIHTQIEKNNFQVNYIDNSLIAHLQKMPSEKYRRKHL